jgi:predicted MFS family arabinose efflux permease
LLVPLADLLENRRLMIATAVLATVSLLLAGTSSSGQGQLFLAYALLIGFSSVAVQMLVPLAAHLAPEQQRGRVVGNIMGGLLLGILLARPLSSLVADHFRLARGVHRRRRVMLAIILLLALTLPRRGRAQGQLCRADAVAAHLAAPLSAAAPALVVPGVDVRRVQPVLDGGAAGPGREHGLSQSQIAVFALVGAVGAVAAPMAGRLADAGHARAGSLLALLLAPAALLLGLTRRVTA